MSFAKDLWQGFNCIKKEFISKRNNIKALLYFISEQKNLEYEYAEGLSRLALTKFNNLSNNTTFEKAIDAYINGIDKESKARLDYIKSIEDKVINPLIHLIKDQMKTLEVLFFDYAKNNKDFQQVLTNISSIQNDFYSSIIISETALTKLTIAKDDQMYSPEKLSQLAKVNDKKINIVKDYKNRYEDYVNEANQARDKFIDLNSQILSSLEQIEYDFINLTKACLLQNAKDIESKYEFLLKYNNEHRETYDQISAENDINKFINTNKTHYSHPFKFAFIPYNMYNGLKSNTEPNPELLEIKMQVSRTLNDIISYKTQEEIDDPQNDEKIKKIEDIMFTFWEGKGKDENTRELFDEYLQKAVYRKYILQIMDRYRTKGLFEINQNCFNILGLTLNKIITLSIMDKDYSNIDSCLILSQTFSYNQLFLQNTILNHEGLKLKDTWIGLINHSIDNELNSIKGYKDVLIENEVERTKKISSIVLGKLMTVCYNMQLLEISNDLIQEIINDYSEKYHIEKELLEQLQFNDNIKEINNEIHLITQDSIIS